MFLASCGWLWLVVGGFGSLWLVLYFITNDVTDVMGYCC